MSYHVAFFVSNEGSIMAPVLDAIEDRTVKGVKPRLVVASKPGIKAVRMAVDKGIPLEDIEIIETGPNFSERLLATCTKRRIDVGLMYGWLPLMPPEVVGYFDGRLVNAHPGPLDTAAPPGHDFGGKGMYGRRAHAARILFTREVGRDPWTRAVAHRVTPELDRGEVLGERLVDIYIGTDVESLRRRVRTAEQDLHIEVLRQLAQGSTEPVWHKPYWLVKPEEQELLVRCKTKAIELYPNG